MKEHDGDITRGKQHKKVSVKESKMPRFINHCSHKKKEYLGTISRGEKVNKIFYDLYFFEELGSAGICLRFGNKPEEHISHEMEVTKCTSFLQSLLSALL